MPKAVPYSSLEDKEKIFNLITENEPIFINSIEGNDELVLMTKKMYNTIIYNSNIDSKIMQALTELEDGAELTSASESKKIFDKKYYGDI